MKQTVVLPDVDFGHPEAEHDTAAIERSFYEADFWRSIAAGTGMPFVVGRKGSGKSATAARLEYVANSGKACFVRIVPANFRHVEVRDLLACLVNRSASWQYIYRKVWEGIILGQIVRHTLSCHGAHSEFHLSASLEHEIAKFNQQCEFYVADVGDALTEVLTRLVKDVGRKSDAVSQVELRKALEPYTWAPLVQALASEFKPTHSNTGLFIAIDGLDEHWDSSPPSLYFLAELLAVTKNFTAVFKTAVHFLICLRDNIFRALVDTKTIEYDKMESLVVNLEWNARSLFELIARRVSPFKRIDVAVDDLRELLPESIDAIGIEEYLSRHILQRPRDYVNFFRMLQRECGVEPRAGEGHVIDTVGKYCANRLIDLENEFGHNYPGISKCISSLQSLPETFKKEDLLRHMTDLLANTKFRREAPGLIMNFGQPLTLCRILISIGVIGIYDATSHALRFVHEFSESRVAGLWDAATLVSVHPVYCYHRPKPRPDPAIEAAPTAPAILMHPADYIPDMDAPAPTEGYAAMMTGRRKDLIAGLAAIDKGQAHYRRYEEWVREVLRIAFIGDLTNLEEQIQTKDGNKKFEIIFDIVGEQPPWTEIKAKYETHRLLVECKNTEEPTDADFNKLTRDMQSLNIRVALLAYRGLRREPRGKVLEYQRAAFMNSNRQNVIISLSDSFFIQCLEKPGKSNKNFNTLWRDHLHRWLPL